MALSIRRDRNGPVWPLGLIIVVTPGTPVRITSLIDPSAVDAPGTLTSSTSNEYTPRCQQIIFQGYKSNSGTGLTNNTGQIYVMVKQSVNPAGSGNRTDYGAMVVTIAAGQTFVLASAPVNKDVFSPYDYYVDADTASDSCLVTLVIQ